jgi:hypothetical protein
MVPGPNVMLVASRALAHGFRAALPAAIGLGAAAVIYLAIPVVGLTAMIAAFPRALIVLRILGECYLAYIGVRMIMAALSPADFASASTTPVSRASLFVQGFLTCFSNPKALLYWSGPPTVHRPGGGLCAADDRVGAYGNCSGGIGSGCVCRISLGGQPIDALLTRAAEDRNGGGCGTCCTWSIVGLEYARCSPCLLTLQRTRRHT